MERADPAFRDLRAGQRATCQLGAPEQEIDDLIQEVILVAFRRFVLADLMGYTGREIGERLGFNPSAAASRAARRAFAGWLGVDEAEALVWRLEDATNTASGCWPTTSAYCVEMMLTRGSTRLLPRRCRERSAGPWR